MSKSSSRITAKDRVHEFGKENFHCDGHILFCTACNKAVDHIRRNSIVDHLASAKHKEAQKRKAEGSSEVPAKKQRTVTGLFHQQSLAKDHRSAVIHDFISMLVQANIPIEKADHPAVRHFILTHVRDGGAIPKSRGLRQTYVPQLIEGQETKLHQLFNSSGYICIMADETTDVQSRPVLNILFQKLSLIDDLECPLQELPPPFLIKTVFLERANHSTVSQALVQCCADFQIDFSKVMLFISDSASYMMKAWRDILSAIWVNCHHMNCHAHVIALAGNAIRLSLHDVDRCVALLKSILVKAPSRRNRFLRHLQDHGIDSPTNPPEPIITRWNTWFNAVCYHAPFLPHYSEFIRAERQEETDTAALRDLSNILQSQNLRENFNYVADKCPRLIATLDSWQSRKPQVHEVYNTMTDLINWLKHLSTSIDGECAVAMTAAATKLQEYTQDNKQHAIRFLKAVRILDPNQLPSLDLSCYATLKDDLRFPTHCDEEWPIYLGIAGDIGQGRPEPLSFWKSVKQRVPHLAAHATLLLQLPVNTADVERSFSRYNMLLTAQRQSLTEENIAGLLKLYFNQF
jgi:hypothetical protein